MYGMLKLAVRARGTLWSGPISDSRGPPTGFDNKLRAFFVRFFVYMFMDRGLQLDMYKSIYKKEHS